MKRKTMMKIVILFPNCFPEGGASSKRVFHIAKGLSEAGNDIEILILRGTEQRGNKANRKVSGIYSGIPFQYVTKSVIWPGNKIHKIFNFLYGVIMSIKILSRNSHNKIDCIISYAHYDLFSTFVFSLLCKYHKIKYLYATDEYPWVVIHKRKYSEFYRKFYLLIFYRQFDGLIVMTQVLHDYLSDKVRQNCRFIHIPMTVDIESYRINKDQFSEKYIAYCGYDLYEEGGEYYSKDGTAVLIDAFSRIVSEFPDIKLYIIGENSQVLKMMVHKLGIDSKVVFTGTVSPDQTKKYIVDALILALAKPDNIQNKANFPTKLGEYLATGNPVVVTKVGEIPLYLKDGLSAYMANPGSSDDFAAKLKFALQQPEKAKKIGMEGQKVADECFNYKKQGAILNEFISELVL